MTIPARGWLVLRRVAGTRLPQHSVERKWDSVRIQTQAVSAARSFGFEIGPKSGRIAASEEADGQSPAKRKVDTLMKSNAYRVGILVAAACVAGVAWAGAPEFEITRSTIDCGGFMRSTGLDLELSGTIGQFDAGSAAPKLAGGDFELTGGFWMQIPFGDCEDDGDVDLRDHRGFPVCATGPGSGPPSSECTCFDVNRDAHVDMADFAVIQTTHTGG